MNIVFFGSPQFALPSLKAIQSSNHKILAVISQPDKPRGRKLNVSAVPTKEFALQNNIKVLTPINLNDEEFVTEYKSLNADINIVIAYGKIMPQWLIDFPKHGSLNAHASLLPRWRGAAPIRRALITGDKQTGVTIQRVVYDLDAGDIALSEKINIENYDNNDTLSEKLSNLSAKLLVNAIDLTNLGNLPIIKQNEDLITIAQKITKEEQLIDLNDSNVSIFNKIRAFAPKPGAYIFFKGKRLKLFSSKITEANDELGKVIDINDKGIVLAAGSGSLLLTEVQAEGSKVLNAFEFAKGQRIQIGDKLIDDNSSGRCL